MKLKEKLAIEFSERDFGDSEEQIYAFLAGFEKARELAKEIHEDCGAASGCCLDEFEKLGEEEVEL